MEPVKVFDKFNENKMYFIRKQTISHNKTTAKPSPISSVPF